MFLLCFFILANPEPALMTHVLVSIKIVLGWLLILIIGDDNRLTRFLGVTAVSLFLSLFQGWLGFIGRLERSVLCQGNIS